MGLFSRSEKGEKQDAPEGSGSGRPPPPKYSPSPQPTATASSLPGTLPPFRSNFACMSMHLGDLLRLMAFPPEIHSLVRQVINSSWPRGVQSESTYHTAYQFKLRGFPWYGTADDAVHARRLMMRLLANLYAAGWVLSMCTDVSKSVSDLDTMLFRHQVPAPVPCEWLCISFSRGDRLRLIDAPAELVDGLGARLVETGVLQSRRDHASVAGCHEFKMVGYPWYSSGSNATVARGIVLMLVSVLEDHGWTVYGCVDQKAQMNSGDGASGDSDTWHCCRQVGWTPGQPVLHR